MDQLDQMPYETEPKKFGQGLKFGIIAGVIYILLLLIRYLFFGGNPMIFTGTMFVSYLIILFFFFQAGLARRKEKGGYADIKDIFSNIFIAIVITEFCYGAFNYIYLNYIDPGFYTHFLESTLNYVRQMGGSEEAINQQIEKMQSERDQSKMFSNALLGFATWVIIDSIIGLIFALVLKKEKAKF